MTDTNAPTVELSCAPEQLIATLKSCKGGEKITLTQPAPRIVFENLKFDVPVTIVGRFEGYTQIKACKGLQFLSCEFVETAGTMCLGISNCQDVNIQRSKIFGVKMTSDGYYAGLGLKYTDCDGCGVFYSELFNLGQATSTRRGQGRGVKFLRNLVHHIRTDSFRLDAASHVEIGFNHLHSMFPAGVDHPDVVQLHMPAGDPASDDIWIHDLVYEIGEGRPVQGVLIGATADRPVTNLRVERSCFFGGMYDAVVVSNAPGAVVVDNFAQGLVTNLHNGQSMSAFIYTKDSPNAVLEGNVSNSRYADGKNTSIPLAKDGSDRVEVDKWLAAHPWPSETGTETPAPTDPRDGQILDLQAQVDKLKVALADAQTQVTELNGKLQSASAALTDLQAQVTSLTSELQATKAALDAAYATINVANKRLAAVQAALTAELN